jgi:hypothetical protein
MPPSAALGAHDAALEVGDFRLWRIAADFDYGLVPASIVVAIGDEIAHALPAPVVRTIGYLGYQSLWFISDGYHSGGRRVLVSP